MGRVPALLLFIGVAFLLRLDFLIASNFNIDSDEAIVGLMAKHILEGALPIFYYGQHYMGSLEAFMLAGLSAVIGLNAISLKLVPLFFALVFIVLVYSIANELGGKKSAIFAALFAACSPVAFIVWSVKARGGFIELIVIGSLAVLFLIHSIKREQLNAKSLFLISALLGLGWWVNNQVIYFMLPVFLVVLSYCSRKFSFVLTIKYSCFSVFSFLLGSLPFWIYNLKNDWASLSIFTSSSDGRFFDYLIEFFTTSLPILLGARKFWSETDTFPWASEVVLGLYVVLALVYLTLSWKKLGKNAEWLLLVFLLTVVLVFVSSSYGHLSEAPRYLLPAYLGVFVLSGLALGRLYAYSHFFSILLAALIIGINLLSCYFPTRQVLAEPFVFEQQRVSADHSELIEWLKLNNYKHVQTNYWIGYRLAFETNEEIRFAMFGEPHQVRIDDYEENVPEDAPFVLVQAQAKRVLKSFDLQGIVYDVVRLSNYDVVYNVRPSQEDLLAVKPSYTATATHQAELVENIFDNDPATRWGSGAPQNPEMAINIDFTVPSTLRAIKYDLSTWRHDYPRSFRLSVTKADGSKQVLISPSDYYYVKYNFENNGHYTIYFPALEVKSLHLEQLGQDSFFDWSIAELELFS